MLPSAASSICRGHSGAIYDLAWWPSRVSWCTAGGDGVVALWGDGTENGKAVFHHSNPFYSVTTWNDGLVAGNATGEIFVLREGHHAVVHSHRAPVFSLHVDGEGFLWSGDGEGNVVRHAQEGRRVEAVQHIATNLGKIRHMAAHPEGLLIASGSGAWSIVGIDGTLQSTSRVHEGSCYWAIHLPEKNAIVSGGQDGKLVACQGEKAVLELPIHQSAVYRGVRHGQVLWTAGRDRDVKAWDALSLESLGKLDRPHGRSVNALALGGPDLSHVATAGDDRTMKVWEL